MSDNASIPLCNISNIVKVQDLFKLHFISFKYDWFGKPLNVKADFLLAYNTERIYFAFKCEQKAFINPDHQKKIYTLGLWEYDVVEFFLSDPKSGRYQEFNISPAGSWWSMLFSEYRKEYPNHFILPQELEIISNLTENMWEVGFSIPLDQLSLDFSDLKQLTGNVTSIINGRDRKYLSWANIKSGKPDFHRNYCFVPLVTMKREIDFKDLTKIIML